MTFDMELEDNDNTSVSSTALSVSETSDAEFGRKMAKDDKKNIGNVKLRKRKRETELRETRIP